MVEVFKTNVLIEEQANHMLAELSKACPSFKINFDLDDCDKILRVEGSDVQPEWIIKMVNEKGFHCAVLT